MNNNFKTGFRFRLVVLEIEGFAIGDLAWMSNVPLLLVDLKTSLSVNGCDVEHDFALWMESLIFG